MNEFHQLSDLARQELRRIKVSRLKKAIDPISFYSQVGQEIRPKDHATWVKAGLCPFHEDAKAGSFYIHLQEGAFKCFSCGAKGSDIISYITFTQALEKLTYDWGVIC
jgi:DNA primase